MEEWQNKNKCTVAETKVLATEQQKTQEKKIQYKYKRNKVGMMVAREAEREGSVGYRRQKQRCETKKQAKKNSTENICA